MFALVENDSITKTLNSNKGITIGENQYPQSIYTLWSPAEREAIGIYEVVYDDTNKKDQKYYSITDQSLNFAGGVVTASYGSPTARDLNDTNQKDNDGVELDPVVVVPGLKTAKKELITEQASSLLTPTDWHVVKATEVDSYSVPAEMTTYRAAVRTASNDMETKIDACSTVDELATLYQYVNTGTVENPVIERPLGEFPEEI